MTYAASSQATFDEYYSEVLATARTAMEAKEMAQCSALCQQLITEPLVPPHIRIAALHISAKVAANSKNYDEGLELVSRANQLTRDTITENEVKIGLLNNAGDARGEIDGRRWMLILLRSLLNNGLDLQNKIRRRKNAAGTRTNVRAANDSFALTYSMTN